MIEQKEAYDILKCEWQHCESGIARYDTLIFQARTWSITVSAALIAASVSTKIPSILLIGVFAPYLFLLIEAQNKVYQTIFIHRSLIVQKEIQNYGQGNEINLSKAVSPGIAAAFEDISSNDFLDHLSQISQFCRYPNILLFYISTSIPCLICFLLASVIGLS